MPRQPLRYDQPAWNLDARVCVVLGAVIIAAGSRLAFWARPVRMKRHTQNSDFSSSLVVAWDENVLLRVVLGVRFPQRARVWRFALGQYV